MVRLGDCGIHNCRGRTLLVSDIYCKACQSLINERAAGEDDGNCKRNHLIYKRVTHRGFGPIKEKDNERLYLP